MKPIAEIAAFMHTHQLMLVTAESCTAGLIAARLADVAGAGSLLDCAFVVYSPEAKTRCLNVRRETMETFGLTSEAVAAEMARGALACSRANIAVANTGVAESADDETPPGTQCFAWAFRQGQDDNDIALFTEVRRFSGDRNAIRETGAQYALHRIPHYFDLSTQAHLDRPSGPDSPQPAP